MSQEKVTPENITKLVDYIMKTKDPAVVGLRRILKKKADEGEDFPLRKHDFNDFSKMV